MTVAINTVTEKGKSQKDNDAKRKAQTQQFNALAERVRHGMKLTPHQKMVLRNLAQKLDRSMPVAAKATAAAKPAVQKPRRTAAAKRKRRSLQERGRAMMAAKRKRENRPLQLSVVTAGSCMKEARQMCAFGVSEAVTLIGFKYFDQLVKLEDGRTRATKDDVARVFGAYMRHAEALQKVDEKAGGRLVKKLKRLRGNAVRRA